MQCNACRIQMEALLSSIPHKWREQIATVICDHIVNQGIECSSIAQCLSDEMTTLDYACLANSQSEWDSLSVNGKIQRIIDKVCQDFNIPTYTFDDTDSVNFSGDGINTPITADVILDPRDTNILEITNDGLYAAERPIGTDIEIIAALAAQCTGLGDEQSLSQGGLMKDISGWTITPTTMAQSLRNMWITICDMRGAVIDVQDCCSATGCNEATDLTVVLS